MGHQPGLTQLPVAVALIPVPVAGKWRCKRVAGCAFPTSYLEPNLPSCIYCRPHRVWTWGFTTGPHSGMLAMVTRRCRAVGTMF